MKHKIGIAVCIILIVCTVGFIWSNSFKPTEDSQQESAVVAQKVEQLVAENVPDVPSSFFKSVTGYIRKAAHMAEFFLLGVEITVLALLTVKRFAPQTLWNLTSAALAIALADESIQILSGRGPRVQDVLLDFCGAVLGLLLTLLVHFIALSCKKGRKKYGEN